MDHDPTSHANLDGRASVVAKGADEQILDPLSL